ncbi:hypothetical protein [Glaciecola petra]|uniref:PEP-CTERM sorting domain-containing protein n=1 Tax=Glaciecola petra TaxID=3075602 RepID=A0ABU2ZRS1_9ALTE|nr:hypothetical protein [Aestuariibacter sp. P117]MDT0595014.1 hypothetical protein [Aestuariibacter sp. P117]
MKRYLFLLLFLTGFSSLSQASLLFNFDDDGLQNPIPTNYKGLIFSNIFEFTASQSNFGTPLASNPVGNIVGYNGYENDSSIGIASGTFTFNGGLFARGYLDDVGATLSLTGMLGNQTLYSFNQVIDSTSVYDLTLNWTGIDKLTISGSRNYVTFDNLLFNAPVTPNLASAPSVLSILLVGLVFLRFRKSN